MYRCIYSQNISNIYIYIDVYIYMCVCVKRWNIENIERWKSL